MMNEKFNSTFDFFPPLRAQPTENLHFSWNGSKRATELFARLANVNRPLARRLMREKCRPTKLIGEFSLRPICWVCESLLPLLVYFGPIQIRTFGRRQDENCANLPRSGAQRKLWQLHFSIVLHFGRIAVRKNEQKRRKSENYSAQIGGHQFVVWPEGEK